MKINIFDLVNEINHCKYCINLKENKLICNKCLGANNYYDKPSEFKTDNILASDYFTLLSEYTKLLNKLGFEFKK